MKTLVFGGGLGNQIFEYAFYLYMKDKFPNEKIYGIYNKKRLSEHYGLEIDKWFKVNLPPANCWATITTAFLYFYKKIVGHTKFVDTYRDYCKNEKAIAFLAFKYTNRYFPQYNWINFRIEEENLSVDNKAVLKKIRSYSSVFIHVRRGDFFSSKYKQWFEGTCPISYYEKSIEHIKRVVTNPLFFIFSDDILWAKENLPLNMLEVCFVDWNSGANSPIDMYLMSQCKYAIIANSSFSYWGAYLGRKKELVFYPTKWNNGFPSPEIFEKEWITY